MSLKDIEKLKERVDKDPNSKLFVPLAEEYKKEGMLDEAIRVLLGGIERQPGYMSARVSLGKIYLEKGMMNQARSEFENVIKSIPDNLYAHKKLAEIYRDLGEKELSISSYKTVLKLNALDDDATSNLRDLEGEEELAQVGAAPELKGETDNAASMFQKALSDAGQEEAGVEAIPEISLPPHNEEELSAFKDSIFGDKSPAAEHQEAGNDAEEEAIEIVEEDVLQEEVSFEDVGEAVVTEVPGFADIPVELNAGAAAAKYREEERAQSVSPVSAAGGRGLEDANGFIAEGNYPGAVTIYRNMLSTDPGNKKVLQRMEELKVLLKLMGKDKETLIAMLDEFLKGIQKRRDEFHGSP
jgi:tetratricopeptide (TPR) repeat protein